MGRRIISEEDIDKMTHQAAGHMATEEKVQMMLPKFFAFSYELLLYTIAIYIRVFCTPKCMIRSWRSIT